MDLQIFRYYSLDSTNLEAIRFAALRGDWACREKGDFEAFDTNEAPPFVFQADSQTAGRGQRGHSWTAPRGGLYVSILYPCLLRDNVAEKNLKPGLFPGQISLLSALTVFQTVANLLKSVGKDLSGLKIRWPNDLYFEKRKISGILTESACPGWLVTGIGINVNGDLPESDPTNPDFCPICLKRIAGQEVNLDNLLDHMLNRWQENWRLTQDTPEAIAASVQAHLDFVGVPVLIAQPERPDSDPIQGVFRGIDKQGFARLQTDSGERRFASGRIRPVSDL